MEIDQTEQRLIAAGAIFSDVLMTSLFLFLDVPIGPLLGHKGLNMMMKLTGLVLTAIAVQIIFTGVRALLNRPPA